MKTNHKDSENLVFFDLETKRGSAQVGWSNIARMGLSLAVTYSERDGYQTFLDSQVDALIRCLKSADAVVGFNHVEFDYKVLTAYTKDDLKALNNIDMFQIIYQKTRRKISLDKLAKGSLGRSKSGDGLDALRWYKEGRIDLIEKYCREDVSITRELYYHGCEKGVISYIHDDGRPVEVRVDWAYSSGRINPVYSRSRNSLERDILQAVHEGSAEFVMYEMITRVAKQHGVFTDTNNPNDLSADEKLLFKDVQNAARRLASEKCVVQNGLGSNYWIITPKGIDKLRLLREQV